jgi:hypothetical protein
MKRVYMREPGTGKFLPIGWYCPYCNATEFSNQCRTCGKIEPNPDREAFKKTGICYRCEQYTEKMAKSHVPLTTFIEPAAEGVPEDSEEDPCAFCLSWEVCPGTLNDKWCKAHRKYQGADGPVRRDPVKPVIQAAASMPELVKPLVSSSEFARMKKASEDKPLPATPSKPVKFGVAVCRSRKCTELKKDDNPYGPQGERCMVFNSLPGTFPCCIKDPEIPARTFLHTALWSLLSKAEQGKDKRVPGPRNCPAACPYKVSEEGKVKDRNNKDFYSTKKGLIWKCAFSGDVLGTGLASYCPCHVLDSSDPGKQIETLKVQVFHRRMGPSFDRNVCSCVGCPDGILRVKAGDILCPIIKRPFIDLRDCPLWRIPGEQQKDLCTYVEYVEPAAAALAPGKHGSLRLRSRLSSSG